jgi:hypothetical protein
MACGHALPRLRTTPVQSQGANEETARFNRTKNATTGAAG